MSQPEPQIAIEDRLFLLETVFNCTDAEMRKVIIENAILRFLQNGEQQDALVHIFKAALNLLTE